MFLQMSLQILLVFEVQVLALGNATAEVRFIHQIILKSQLIIGFGGGASSNWLV